MGRFQIWLIFLMRAFQCVESSSFFHFFNNIRVICILELVQYYNKYITQMDPRLYHYQYRRPRLSNPTQYSYQQHSSSYNVNNSMTFFMNPSNINYNQPKSSYEEAHSLNSSHYNNNNYGQQNRQTPRETPGQTPRERSQSQLSSYGNNSLSFNERQIFNKQNSKFDIISLKPKQVPDRIKEYPKLTLENRDDYYYKKVQMMRERQANTQALRNSPSPRNQNGVVAGKHTFAPEEGKNPNFYQYGRYFTPKMLNHADEVSNIL